MKTAEIAEIGTMLDRAVSSAFNVNAVDSI